MLALTVRLAHGIATMQSGGLAHDAAPGEPLRALLGPLSIPGGRGTLTAAQRALIKDWTGCNAEVLKRTP